VLPSEASARLRREALNTCQELTRVTVECSRALHNLVLSIKESKSDIEPSYEKVVSLKEEATSLKRTLSEELISAGAILFSREDFLRLALPLTEITDLAEGVAFRLKELKQRKAQAGKSNLENVSLLSEKVLDCVHKLRDVIFALNFDVNKVDQLAKEVEQAERSVDDTYRKTVVEIFYSNAEVPALLLLRDVAEMLEEMADKAEDAADSARMLALSVL
jgi:predicted phosphate transport protein (TIGR00153 family)